MIRVALTGLAQRRLRTFLTALAIVVGVATVSAALTLGDTLEAGSDALSKDAYRGTAAAVTARTAFTSGSDSFTKDPTLPASALDAVRRVPEAGVAAGDLTTLDAKLLDRDGDPVGQGPYFGVGLDTATPGFERLTPFRLRDGAWPRGAGPGRRSTPAARTSRTCTSATRCASRPPARSAASAWSAPRASAA